MRSLVKRTVTFVTTTIWNISWYEDQPILGKLANPFAQDAAEPTNHEPDNENAPLPEQEDAPREKS